MKLQRSSGSQRIGLTPLIDVVFILLLFFMLATNFQQPRSLLLKTNTSTGPSVQANRPVLTLQVTSDDLRVDGRPLDVTRLPALLDQRVALEPALMVVVRGASTVTVQRLVQVVDQLRRSRVVDYHLDVESGQ